MDIRYARIDTEIFNIQIPDWTVITEGVTWDRHRLENGIRVVVLAGQNENGQVTGLFQEERWGLYHNYRSLDHAAPDFSTRELVVEKMIELLDSNHRIFVQVVPRPQYTIRWIESQIGRLFGVRDSSTSLHKKRYVGQIAFPISLIENSNNPASSAEVVREVDFEDLEFRNIFLFNPDNEGQPMADSAIN